VYAHCLVYNSRMTKKILLVDDLLFDVMLTQRAIQDCSVAHEVTTVSDGAEALQLLKTKNFDLVLLDIRMPRVDGFEVLKHMQNTPSLSHIPVVMISGSYLEADRVRAQTLGASAYVHKSMDYADFQHSLKHTLSLHGFC